MRTQCMECKGTGKVKMHGAVTGGFILVRCRECCGAGGTDATRPHHVGFISGVFACLVCGTQGMADRKTPTIVLCCDCPADAPVREWPTVQIGGPIDFNSHRTRAVVMRGGGMVLLPVEQEEE